MSNNNTNLPIYNALSRTRLTTYLHAVGAESFEGAEPLELYRWNAEVSSAFLFPLHILEITLRNAIADSIAACFTPHWPYNQAFLRRLPANGRYKQRNDLSNVADRYETTSKVIPELRFVFWEKMLTSRHDDRIWNEHFLNSFPNANNQRSVAENREDLSERLGRLRRLRNRVAHHEPIFTRDLQADLDNISNLIQLRCLHTSQWMKSHQKVITLLDSRP